MTANLGLSDYQFHFGPPGPGGLTFGADHLVDLMRIEGLTDLEVLYSDQQHLQRHGDVPGIHLAVGKTFRLEIEIRKATQSDAQWRNLILQTEDAFTVVFSEQFEFHWKLPGEVERFIRCRPVRRRRIIDPDSELGICRIEVELRAADPRFYTASKKITPFQSGTFDVRASGTVVSYPRITFNLGSNNSRARLVHNGTGIVLDVIDGYTEGQQGFADMDKYVRGDQGLIIYDHNNSNKYGAWVPPRALLFLNPGVNSLTLLFAASCKLEWWDSHI